MPSIGFASCSWRMRSRIASDVASSSGGRNSWSGGSRSLIVTGSPAIASKIPSKSACCSEAAGRGGAALLLLARGIISRTTGRRSSDMNMCSVRQADALGAELARLCRVLRVSAFARTRRRRTSSAQPRIVPKFSSMAGGTSGTAPTITLPVPPSIEITSPRAAVPADRHRAGGNVDREPCTRRRTACPSRATTAAWEVIPPCAVRMPGLDEAVDVVVGRLPANEDDVLAVPPPLLGRVGVEDDRADRGARRGVQPLRGDLVVGVRVDAWMEELVELARVDPRPPLRGRSAPRRPSPPRSAAQRRRSACPSASGGGRASPPRP